MQLQLRALLTTFDLAAATAAAMCPQVGRPAGVWRGLVSGARASSRRPSSQAQQRASCACGRRSASAARLARCLLTVLAGARCRCLRRHNNHHAFEFSARHGLEWWQFDMTWIVIRSLQAVGLATNVKLPTEKQKARLAFPSAQPAA